MGPQRDLEFLASFVGEPIHQDLIYFVFIFSFAMLRLWVTLLILTWGLKQSYIRGS
jgi:hypothetical protein